MSFSRTERGGASTPLIVAVLAVAVIGGTVYFLNAGGAGEVSIEDRGSGFKATDPIALERPAFESVEDELPRVTPESDEILKGDLIKFHDRMGNVKFRSREKVAGFNQMGETIYWQPEMQIGPSVGGGKVSKSKGIRRSAQPPKMVMRNGRAVMRPGQTLAPEGAGKGADDSQTGGGNPDLTGDDAAGAGGSGDAGGVGGGGG